MNGLTNPRVATTARVLLTAFAVALPVASPSAQRTVVVPPNYMNNEAPGIAFWALSPFAARRQLIVDSSNLAPMRNRLLKGLSLRRNTGGQQEAVGGRVRVEMWLSHCQNRPRTMSVWFASNRGGNPTKVFDGIVQLPDRGASTTTPASWDGPDGFRFAFMRPFRYEGGSLCIETVTHAPNAGDEPWWPIDAAVQQSQGQSVTMGDSCIPGVGKRSAVVPASSLALGATASFTLNTAAPSGIATLMIGRDTTKLGVGNLPMNLGFIGAPGCTIFVNPEAFIPASVQALSLQRGMATIRATVYPTPAVIGATFHSQWLMVDSQANALGVTFSNGVQVKIGATPSNWRINWLEATDLSLPVGSMLPGRVPVIRFDG